MKPVDPILLLTMYLGHGYTVCYIDDDKGRRDRANIVAMHFPKLNCAVMDSSPKASGMQHYNVTIAVNPQSFALGAAQDWKSIADSANVTVSF